MVVIRKEEDFSVINSFNVTSGKAISIFVISFFILFGVALFLSKTILKVWFDPALKDSENIALLFKMSETVDSLRMEVIKKDNYVRNIQRIMDGETEDVDFYSDSAQLLERKSPELNFQPSEATLSILRELGGAPLESNVNETQTIGFLSESYFFSPLKGVVMAIFDPKKDHFGIDIVAKENEPVKTIADGTVIFSSWTLATGYVVAVQHSNDLISIYKHNSVILKNIGDAVKGGEIISIIGNTGELTTGTHLHFEIWYQGSPLNPQDLISFD